MPTMPDSALPEEWAVVDIGRKFEGRDAARRDIGAQVKVLFTIDHCAQISIIIPGLDADSLPSPELVNERNLRLDFITAKFQNLVITFSGGDYGAIRYKGTATGVEFLNLNPPPARPVPSK